MNNIGEKIIMLDFVVLGNLFIVDSQFPSFQAAFIYFWWGSSKFAAEDIQNLFVHPPPFGIGSEGEVIRIYFSQA